MNLNRPYRSVLLAAVGLTAVLALSSCSLFKDYLPGGGEVSSSSSAGSSSSQQAAEEHTLQGTLNMIDTDMQYLILVTDDGYSRLSFADTDLDLSGLEPGDEVTVTYTGTLDPDSEDVTAQLTSVTKNS